MFQPYEIFLNIFNMSIAAGWFILVPIEKGEVQNCTSFDADLTAPN